MKRKKDAEVASIGGVSTMPAAAMVPTQSPVSAPKAAWETELPEIVVSAERTTNSNIADIATADNTVEVSHDKAPTIGSVTPNTRKAVEEVQSTPRRSPRDVTLGIPLDMPTREPKANVRGNDERIRRRMGNPLAGFGKGIAQLAAMVDFDRDKRSVRSYERANEKLAARESRAAYRRQRDAEKAAARESRQAERDMARQARTDARDAERDARLAREREAEAIRAEERLARNAQIDARRAERKAVAEERRDERLANRADRAEAREEAALSRMEEREANRMARDAARDANILAREEERLARVGERNNRRAERAAIKEENAIERAENRQLREEQATARRDAREASRAERIADRTERKAEQDAIAAERRADRAIARENAAIAREEKNAARAESREAAAAERSVRREERADARAEAKDVRAQAKESQRRAVDDERRSVGLDRLNNQEMAGIGTPVDGAIDDVTIDAQRFARGKAIEEPDVAASRAARRQQEDVSPESAPISDAEARVMRGYANTDAPNSSEGGQDGAVGSNVEGAPMTDAEVASAREARGYAATPQGATKAEGNTGDSKPLTEEKTSVATENSGVDPSLWQVAAKDGDTGTVKNDRANATIEEVAEEAKKADDPLAFLTQLASQYSDEDRKADEKRKKAAQWILAAQMLGDSIGALSNVYWTGKGANAMKFEPGAQKAATATYQLEKDIREAREKAAKAQYDATLKKYAMEMEKAKADREQADADRKHEETVRHNKATEDISRLSAENAAKSANTAMYNAETSRMNASTASRNASVNEAEERRKAEQYNKQHGDRKFLIGDQWVNIPKDKWEGVVGSIYNSLPEEIRKVYETQVTDELGIKKETRKAPTIAVMDAAVRQYAQDPAVMEAILKAAGVKVEEITNDEFGTGGGRGASAAPSNVQTGKEVTTPTAKKKVW